MKNAKIKKIDLTMYGIRKAKKLMLEYKSNSNKAMRFILPCKAKPKYKPSNFKYPIQCIKVKKYSY